MSLIVFRGKAPELCSKDVWLKTRSNLATGFPLLQIIIIITDTPQLNTILEKVKN
jgi:hypothetical protein